MARKHNICLYALAVACVLCAAVKEVRAGEARDDTVVARANGRPVMLSQLNDTLLRLYGREALERLIYREVLKDAMEQAGFRPSREDLALALEEERRNIAKAYDGKKTLADMAEQELGMTEQEYAREVLALRLFLRSAIVGDGNVSERELVGFYARNIGRYQDPPRVRISHILIRAATGRTGEMNWDKAQKIAQEVYNKATAGEDFSKLARRYSQDKKTSARGGNLGFVTPEDFEWGPRMLQVAYELNPGNMAGPIPSMWGYHVIKLTQKIAGITPDFEKIRNLVLADYLDEKIRTEAEFFTKRLVDNARIERYLDNVLKGEGGGPRGATEALPLPKDMGTGGFFINEE